MLVISDTSPLSALIMTGREELLLKIFGRIVIPPAVESELLRKHARLPEWMEIVAPILIPDSVNKANLDPGETEAIALALELQPDALLMDERLGRRVAMNHHLTVTGLLGFLVLAKKRSAIQEVAPLIRELQTDGCCWFGEDLLIEVCESVGESWP
tara:strand:- start:75 stop:542 length:468 start_codon:yes stop_codon:yes gene_type:complete